MDIFHILSFEAFIALCMFSFAASITPGPNNLMLLASGVNFGLRPTVPHMLGIGLGFFAMLLIVGFGLGALVLSSPLLLKLLRGCAIAYMLYLAWGLARSGKLSATGDAKRPMRFVEAVAFQWVNPKAWAMALTAAAVYVNPAHLLISVPTVSVIFAMINLPCVSAWASFGVLLRQVLQNPVRLRFFNLIMAALLVLSTLPFLQEGFH